MVRAEKIFDPKLFGFESVVICDIESLNLADDREICPAELDELIGLMVADKYDVV